VLVSCPVIGVGQPVCRPVDAPLEKFRQLLNERLFTSKQLDESFGVVRHSEAVVPGVSLDIVVGKDIDPLSFAKFYKGTIFASGIEKFGDRVPHVTVELGTISKVFKGSLIVQEFSYVTDAKIIEAELYCLAARRFAMQIICCVAIVTILIYIWSLIMRCSSIRISYHVLEYLRDIYKLLVESLFDHPICKHGICMGSNHASSPSLRERPLRHISSISIYEQ
jgi:hypothetical protein